MAVEDGTNPDYFLKVVDCQWACPAHTPVPEYIRLIAHGRYSDAYMINWESNVFPGILGRTCDRPCEPACRRGRVEADDARREPVAICRLKRVAADFKDDVAGRMPQAPQAPNGRRVACVGAGPASLTVARDLAVLGYEITLFDHNPKPGGLIRTQIPRFRLPEEVIDEEAGYVLGIGNVRVENRRVESLAALVGEGWDAVFVGSGAPRARDLDIQGRREGAANIHLGIDWLASVSFGHVERIGRRVIVLGGGNTAMDCCRTARRLGGEDVTESCVTDVDEVDPGVQIGRHPTGQEVDEHAGRRGGRDVSRADRRGGVDHDDRKACLRERERRALGQELRAAVRTQHVAESDLHVLGDRAAGAPRHQNGFGARVHDALDVQLLRHAQDHLRTLSVHAIEVMRIGVPEVRIGGQVKDPATPLHRLPQRSHVEDVTDDCLHRRPSVRPIVQGLHRLAGERPEIVDADVFSATHQLGDDVSADEAASSGDQIHALTLHRQRPLDPRRLRLLRLRARRCTRTLNGGQQ